MFIPIDVHLKHHRKTRKLAEILAISAREAMSYLVCLWSSAALEAEDGDLSEWEPQDVAYAADYQGDPEEFVRALEATGWLRDGRLHGWDNHYGKCVKAKKAGRRKVERERGAKRRGRERGEEGRGDKEGIGDERRGEGEEMRGDEMRGEEKRRDKKREKQKIARSPKMDSEPSPVSAALVSEDPVLVEEEAPPEPVVTIPITGGKRGEHPIYQDQVDEWARLFPAVDVIQELRACRAWNLANPSRRKTARGVMRHITRWLSMAQDKAKGGNGKDPYRKEGYGFLTAMLGEEPETED